MKLATILDVFHHAKDYRVQLTVAWRYVTDGEPPLPALLRVSHTPIETTLLDYSLWAGKAALCIPIKHTEKHK